MNKVLNNIRLFFCTFSGEDDYIIRRCGTGIQLSFAFIGFFVMVIFAGCWISATTFTEQLLDGNGKWISVPVGIIWALLVLNMYLLLLYTVSPTLLPVAKKKAGKGRKVVVEKTTEQPHSTFTPSFLFRITFITLLATIIAQPLNVLLLSGFAERSLSNYKTEYRISMIIVADSSLIKQEVQNQADFYTNINTKIHSKDADIVAQNVQVLNKKVTGDEQFLKKSKALLDTLSKWNKFYVRKNSTKCDSLRTILSGLLDNELESDAQFIANIDSVRFNDKTLQTDFDNYRNALKETILAKIENYDRLNELLGKSNFYTKTIQILLAENPASWFLTLAVCGVFLLPVYLKFSIRNHSGFYERKKKIEQGMVLTNYDEFKEKYKAVFEEKLRHYHRQTWKSIFPLLHKIEKVSAERAAELKAIIKAELTEHPVFKYEYWADPPFRTQRKQDQRKPLSEDVLLRNIYPDNH